MEFKFFKLLYTINQEQLKTNNLLSSLRIKVKGCSFISWEICTTLLKRLTIIFFFLITHLAPTYSLLK